MILPLILAGVYYRADDSSPETAPAPLTEQLLEAYEPYEGSTAEEEETSAPDEDMNIVFSDEEDEEDFWFPLIEDETEGTTEAPETSAPETEPETSAPETTVPETTVPETTVPETTVPETTVTEKPVQTAPAEDVESVGGAGSDSIKLRVYIRSTKEYKTLTLGEYVKGVVLAEVPTYFELEAFKAQAVAVRTYTLYKLVNDSAYHASAHGSTGADLCTYSGHCQAYTTYEQCASKWGEATADAVWAKVTKAVEQTEGQVMLYNDSPIFACYHSCSYKRTESGKNAWGMSAPYLASVTTPEEGLSVVYSTRTFTASTLKSKLTSANKKISLPEDPAQWTFKYTYNESGRVATLTVGGVSYTGRKIQSLFSLRGSNFSISYDASSGKFVFDVKGFGHGVGMSQYGANIMAKNGSDYDDILLHYYSGVSIKRHNYK